MRLALITGLAGERLTEGERRFLAEARPLGLIIFARNCVSHDQIRRLIADAKSAIGHDDTLVLIDQEGGRVQRLRPPLGRSLPPAAAYARLYETDPETAIVAAASAARLVAYDLAALGINANCAPVLDVPVMGAHDIIGDRAYGAAPVPIAALGGAVADGLLAGGVLPIMKHIPGHGRAMADSHLELPVVSTPRKDLDATDFESFRLLQDLPAAMTAHVVYSDIDPDRPASQSAIVTRDIIRGAIGFDGLLMSDDLGMKALAGPMRDRAALVVAAGSDVALHCSGDLTEMVNAAAGVPGLSGKAMARADACFQLIEKSEPFDVGAAEAMLAAVIASHTRQPESV
ncbi:MAG: beta-N-acetylhexosaminidase [Hyphomicrobium sp.]|nr:beta-N-acetylhexosaminidase [Hyphomicrobium sp.]